MSRLRGIFDFSANYETTYSAPLDARTVVDLKSDLIAEATWDVGDGSSYLFNGLLVCVTKDTVDNNGLYILLDAAKFNAESSWQKLADIQQIEKLNRRIDEIVVGVGGAVQVATLSALPSKGEVNGIYFVIDENATYRWDEDNLKYECVGRDYKEIKLINGGDANKEI